MKTEWNLEPNDWFSLGVKLFGNGWIGKSKVAFTKAAVDENLIQSAALVWLGHLHDLNGNRKEALTCYKNALQCYPGFPVQHSQWNINLTEDWIKLRLKTPFEWKLTE